MMRMFGDSTNCLRIKQILRTVESHPDLQHPYCEALKLSTQKGSLGSSYTPFLKGQSPGNRSPTGVDVGVINVPLPKGKELGAINTAYQSGTDPGCPPPDIPVSGRKMYSNPQGFRRMESGYERGGSRRETKKRYIRCTVTLS
eukprot:Tbor_TRINITY_DN5556_c0_g1::TRINITY_DN5556_c0_g1_i2::g.13835::m.13835